MRGVARFTTLRQKNGHKKRYMFVASAESKRYVVEAEGVGREALNVGIRMEAPVEGYLMFLEVGAVSVQRSSTHSILVNRGIAKTQ